MARIFISYSRRDINFARRLAGDLGKAGFDVWWDISGLKGGDDWVRVIPAAIDSSQYFVILLSPRSIESEWVEKEYIRALGRRMKIVPVLLEQCDVPFALATINYLDFTAHDYSTNLNDLLAALENLPQDDTTPKTGATVPSPAPGIARYIPGIIGGIILLALVLFLVIRPALPVAPTPTPVIIEISPTPTGTPTVTLTATHTATMSSTATLGHTPMDTPTLTITPTPTTVGILRVELCVRTDFTTLVRVGPGKTYGALTNALKGDDCLLFSARNEENTWYMIAPRQPDAQFREFEYGWVSNIALDLDRAGSFSLPVATPAPTATRTPLPTPTATFTPTLTFTPTETFTSTPSDTPIPTDTRVPTATDTPVPTDTDTPEPTATSTP